MRKLLQRIASHPRLLIALGAAAMVLLAVHVVALPWLVRNRVQAALAASGLRGATFRVTHATLWGAGLSDLSVDGQRIERVSIDYSPRDLYHGRIDDLVLRGLQIRLTVNEDRIDAGALSMLLRGSGAPPTSRSSAQSGDALPLARLKLIDSFVLFKLPSRDVKLPVQGQLTRIEPGKFRVEGRINLDRPLLVDGTIDAKSNSLAINAATPGAQDEALLAVARAFAPEASVGTDGPVSLAASIHWANGKGQAQARLEVLSAGESPASQPAQANVRIAGGVLQLVSTFGKSSPTLTAELKQMSFSETEHGVDAQNVSGSVKISGFSPLTTPPDQVLTVGRLKYGDTELTGGQIRFRAENGAILIARTSWDFLGGEVFAQDVRLGIENKPLHVTLQAKDVDLHQVLEKFARGKAQGQGKLNARLPITISRSGISFGDGFIEAEGTGSLSVTDADAIAPVADAAAKNAAAGSQAQVKQNIIQALKDFQFDTLRAEVKNENGRPVAYARLSGHGRGGARQGIIYDWRITGLDEAVRSLLKLRTAVNAAASH
jgi:hypothetical protein